MSVSENDNEGSVYLIAAVMGFISTAGLLFNLVVICVITVLKEYKNTTHWYVLNLALADCMFVILLPLNLVQSLYKKWMFGYPLCVLYQGAFFINYYAGVLFLAVMSFDRYIAIVHPVSAKWRRIRSKFGSWIMTIAVWIVSILASTPLMMKTTVDEVCNFNFEKVHPVCIKHNVPARSCGAWLIAYYNTPNNETLEDFSPEDFVNKYYTDPESMKIYYDYGGSGGIVGRDDIIELEFSQELEDYSCSHSDDPNYRAWIYTNFFVTFVIPLSVMSACYTAILWRVQHPRVPASKPKIFTTRNRAITTEKASRTMDKNIRITIVVVSLVAAFVVCWLPFHAMVLAKIHGINLSSGGCDKLKNAVMLMAYFNSLLNPTLYTFLGVNFYKRLRTTCSKIGLRKRHKVKIKRSQSNGTNGKTNGYAVPLTKMSRASATSEQLQQMCVHIPLQTIIHKDSENEEKGEAGKLNPDASEGEGGTKL